MSDTEQTPEQLLEGQRAAAYRAGLVNERDHYKSLGWDGRAGEVQAEIDRVDGKGKKLTSAEKKAAAEAAKTAEAERVAAEKLAAVEAEAARVAAETAGQGNPAAQTAAPTTPLETA